MITLLSFFIVLSILVFVHELGHFWTAKRFGLKPEEFGFGMPPRALGVYKDKHNKWKITKGSKEVKDASDTIYSINWIPAGGFVKLGEDDAPEGDPNHFNSKPAWQRAIILLAGVAMNAILAMFLFAVGFSVIGLPQILEGDAIANSTEITDRNMAVIRVLPDTPASEAGLSIYDRILSIDGQSFSSVDEIQAYTGAHEGEELVYKLQRGGEEFEKTIIPTKLSSSDDNLDQASDEEEADVIGIGIGLAPMGTVKYPVHLSIWYGIKGTFITMITILFFLKELIMGHGLNEVGGPVMIANMSGQMAKTGLSYIVNFTAMLSLNLAILNALPIPALDGGRILFLIIEKIKRKPIKKEIEAVINNVALSLLLLLVAFVTFRDVARMGFIKDLWDKVF